jgi:hypothetical protein
MKTMDGVLRRKDAGRGFYQKLGADDGSNGIARIFALLADDELRHGSAIRAYEEGGAVTLGNSSILDSARYILRRLSLDDAALANFTHDLERFHVAMDFEADCARAFVSLAAHANKPTEREFFLRIAEDEQTHFTLLENVRELVHAAVEEPSESENGVLDAE